MAMTPQEFADAMRALHLKYHWDEEQLHVEADALMCKLLRDLGYDDGVATFMAMEKWYA